MQIEQLMERIKKLPESEQVALSATMEQAIQNREADIKGIRELGHNPLPVAQSLREAQGEEGDRGQASD